MEGMDGCFHLATIASVERSTQDWTGTHTINLTGAINMFDAARPNHIPVAYASSAAVYGDNAEMPLKEKSSVHPVTAYGADKLGCELHARVASVVHGVPTFGLRFFNVYGPRQDPASPYSGVISIFADRIRSNRSITINGDGQQIRDFISVFDVVKFIITAMKNNHGHPQILNVCTGNSTSIKELAATLIACTENPPTIKYAKERTGDIRVSIGNPSCANQLLKMKATVPIAQGLKELFYLHSDS